MREMRFESPKCATCVCVPGRWGAYSAPPDPLAGSGENERAGEERVNATGGRLFPSTEGDGRPC